MYSVRLACVKHAASVHSEPESNSPSSSLQEPKFSKKTESQTSDSNTRLTTELTRGANSAYCNTSFDERRVLLDQSIVARTGFWLSFFRFQGATTHTTEVGGVKYTISGFLR